MVIRRDERVAELRDHNDRLEGSIREMESRVEKAETSEREAREELDDAQSIANEAVRRAASLSGELQSTQAQLAQEKARAAKLSLKSSADAIALNSMRRQLEMARREFSNLKMVLHE